jgi:hypothetical protein
VKIAFLIGIIILSFEASAALIPELPVGTWTGTCVSADGNSTQKVLLNVFKKGSNSYFWTLEYDQQGHNFYQKYPTREAMTAYLERASKSIPKQWPSAASFVGNEWLQNEPGKGRGKLKLDGEIFKVSHFEKSSKTGDCSFNLHDKF